MLRYAFVLFAVLPLAACASHPEQMSAEIETMTTAPESGQAFAVMAVETGVIPCPRFMESLRAAESKIDAVPRNYPHML